MVLYEKIIQRFCILLLAICTVFSALTLTGCSLFLSDEVYASASNIELSTYGENTVKVWIRSKKFDNITEEDKRVKFISDLTADMFELVFDNDDLTHFRDVISVERVSDTEVKLVYDAHYWGKVETLKTTYDAGRACVKISASALKNSIADDYILAPSYGNFLQWSTSLGVSDIEVNQVSIGVKGVTDRFINQIQNNGADYVVVKDQRGNVIDGSLYTVQASDHCNFIVTFSDPTTDALSYNYWFVIKNAEVGNDGRPCTDLYIGKDGLTFESVYR